MKHHLIADSLEIWVLLKAFRNVPKRNTEHIFEPVIVMVFDSKEEAYQFYNLYSWEVGFGVRFGSSSESKVTRYRTMQKIVCDKEVLPILIHAFSIMCHFFLFVEILLKLPH